MPELPLYYGKPINTPTGHKWAGYAKPKDTERECSQCGTLYPTRCGVGGGCATARDVELFPFDERTHTGVRPDRPHWMNGAHCSSRCYDAAYYEPPFPYGP